MKNLNKQVICDMKQLNNWLSVYKISHNIEKTELVILKSLWKVLSEEINIKLTAKKLYPPNSIKYLGVRTDKFWHWHDKLNDIAVKLKRANALLLKIRNYVKSKTLRNIYEIFDCHFSLNLETKSASQKKPSVVKKTANHRLKKFWVLRSILVNLWREFMKHVIIISLI